MFNYVHCQAQVWHVKADGAPLSHLARGLEAAPVVGAASPSAVELIPSSSKGLFRLQIWFVSHYRLFCRFPACERLHSSQVGSLRNFESQHDFVHCHAEAGGDAANLSRKPALFFHFPFPFHGRPEATRGPKSYDFEIVKKHAISASFWSLVLDDYRHLHCLGPRQVGRFFPDEG